MRRSGDGGLLGQPKKKGWSDWILGDDEEDEVLWQPHDHWVPAPGNLRPDRFGGAAAAYCTRAAAAEAASCAEKRGSCRSGSGLLLVPYRR